MSPPTKKRSIEPGPRNHATRLGNGVFFDAFSALPRDELEKLQVTVRRFRVFISEKMTKVCLRLILKASFLRCDIFRSGAGHAGSSSKSWPVSSGPGFVVNLTSLMEEDVSLPGVAESELTKRLPQYFRHAAIEYLSFKCDPALPNATVGAGLLSSLAAVFETAHVVHYALFERLYFGASSSFRTLMECFEWFRPEESRACPHANHMQIRLNTTVADSELDTSMFDFDNKGEREGEIYLPKDEIRIELPVDDRHPVLRFHYEGWF